MDRREFAGMLPALLAVGLVAEGQEKASLPLLASGVYPPGPVKDPTAQRQGRAFLKGMLKAGNIQLEMHETRQEPGTPHEAIGHHLHSEIWLVKEGTCELMTNGVVRKMEAGEVGLCCAGDEHWVKNAGDTVCSYFVVTVGPPE